MVSKRSRLWITLGQTLNLNLGSFGMGLVMSLTGVALLDLVEIYESDVKTVSHLTTTRSVAVLTGSLLGAKLYDAYNTQVISILTMVASFATVFMIPLSGHLALAHVMVFVCGLGFGAFDTGANVWIIRMWTKNSSPALQVFHLAFAVGCLVAPLIATPFLSTLPPTDYEAIAEPLIAFNETSFLQSHANHAILNDTQSSSRIESTIQYAFGIASGFYLLPIISMIVLYCIDGSDSKPPKQSSLEDALHQKEAAKDIRFKKILLTLLSMYLCVYVAQECTVAQMITAYAVKCDLHLSKSTAARVAAVYFLSFAGCRMGSSLLAIRVTPFQMLLGSHVILAGTATVFVLWGNSSKTVLWASSALLGLGQGPIYGVIVAWTANYMDISNGMMALVIVASSLGALSPPLFVGPFLDHDPPVFLYVCFVTVVMAVVVFLVMLMFVRKRSMLRSVQDKLGNVNAIKGDDAVSSDVKSVDM
ncbi:sodium-dependent glucose transporter 1A-like [Ixodes scapularis]